MVTYTCEKCKKTFNRKYNYTTHINKKFPCTKPTTKTIIKEDNNKSDENEMDIPNSGYQKWQCKFCLKTYKHNFHLNRHLKTCKKKKEDEFKKDTYNVLLKKIEDQNKIIENQRIIIEDLQQKTSGNVKEKDIKDIVRILKNGIKNNRTEIIELKYRL